MLDLLLQRRPHIRIQSLPLGGKFAFRCLGLLRLMLWLFGLLLLRKSAVDLRAEFRIVLVMPLGPRFVDLVDERCISLLLQQLGISLIGGPKSLGIFPNRDDFVSLNRRAIGLLIPTIDHRGFGGGSLAL